jgi:hypothetical protein
MEGAIRCEVSHQIYGPVDLIAENETSIPTACEEGWSPEPVMTW